MSVIAAKYTLSSATAVRIVPSHSMSQQVEIHAHNHTGNDDIYIGDSSLGTALNGFHIPDQSVVDLIVKPGDSLYAIAQAGSPEVQVLILRF
jgi:hypothetical protein